VTVVPLCSVIVLLMSIMCKLFTGMHCMCWLYAVLGVQCPCFDHVVYPSKLCIVLANIP